MSPAANTISKPLYVHATAVALDGKGILIRGPSRAGKSSLALELLNHAASTARLIGDDRVSLERTEEDSEAEGSGRIILRGHPLILGKIEKRGHGIIEVGFAASAIAWLVLDLQTADQAASGHGRPGFSHVNLCGVALPAYNLPWNMDRAGFILDRLTDHAR